MNEVLLKVLNETLDEVTRRMRDTERSIEKGRSEIVDTQKAMKSVEDRLKCKTYEDEQVAQKLEVLRTYLSRFERHPRALTEKMEKLGQEQSRTTQARYQADDQVSRAYQDLNGKKTHLAVLEKEYAELREQWNELSGLISQERASTAV